MLQESTKRNLFVLSAIVLIVIIFGVLYYLYVSVFSNRDYFTTRKGVDFENSFNAGSVDEAISIAESSLKNDPNNNEIKLALAIAYVQKGNLEFNREEFGNKALVLAKEVVAEDVNNTQAYWVLGNAYEMVGQDNEAIQAYTYSVQIDEGMAVSFSNRGRLYESQGLLTEAEADYAKALEIDPELEHALLNSSRFYLSKNDNSKALEFADRLIAITSNNHAKAEAYVVKGSVALENSDFVSALDQFESAQLEDSKFPAVYLGKAKAKLGLLKNVGESEFKVNFESILVDIQTAIDLHENDARAYALFGNVLKVFGSTEDTREKYEKTLEVLPNDESISEDEKASIKAQITSDLAKLK